MGSSQKAISFLSKKKQAKARRAKTTPFRIRNSLIKIFSQYLESLSLHCIGNAEAIKFTFDSLSRKVKNPCLVIKKFKSIKEIFKIFKMKILKTKKLFTYMVVGALVMALSISCKSNEEPTDNTHSNHPPAGTYQMVYGSSLTITATVTVSGGACNIKGTAYKNGDTSGSDNKQYDITITKWYAEAGSTDSGSVFLGNYPSGEATVAAPTGYTSFTVQYYNGNTIRVGFQVDGTWYSTYDMTRQ